jgi:hypothetical protein
MCRCAPRFTRRGIWSSREGVVKALSSQCAVDMDRLPTDVLHTVFDELFASMSIHSLMHVSRVSTMFRVHIRNRVLAKYKYETLSYLTAFRTTIIPERILLQYILRRHAPSTRSRPESYHGPLSWDTGCHRCTAITLAGYRCTRKTREGSVVCWQHM